MSNIDINVDDETTYNEKNKKSRHFWRQVYGATTVTMFVFLLWSLFSREYTIAMATGVLVLCALHMALKQLEFTDKSGHLFGAMAAASIIACLSCFIGGAAAIWTQAAVDRSLLVSFLVLAGVIFWNFAIQNTLQAMFAARGIDTNGLMIARYDIVDGESILVAVERKEMIKGLMGGSTSLR